MPAAAQIAIDGSTTTVIVNTTSALPRYDGKLVGADALIAASANSHALGLISWNASAWRRRSGRAGRSRSTAWLPASCSASKSRWAEPTSLSASGDLRMVRIAVPVIEVGVQRPAGHHAELVARSCGEVGALSDRRRDGAVGAGAFHRRG